VRHRGDDRFVVRPSGERPKDQRVPLTVRDEVLATLGMQIYLVMDRSGKYLKASRSDFAVHSVLDNTPLLRQEFVAEMGTGAPIAHWHIHAERGSFSHLLARAHEVRPETVSKPHDLSSLHFPVGGERFRPCLEDFLEFLVRECGVDSLDGWEQAVREGRERWRRKQLRAAVRDLQTDAAAVLVDNGWTVTQPSPLPSDSSKTTTKW
jgi:hypothetical protein